MMKADYHVHPDYSKDASGSVRDYCERAVEMGLEEICFTPHLDIDPERAEIDDWIKVGGAIVSMRSNWLTYYLNEVEELRKKYESKGLRLRTGIEVDYAPGIEAELGGIVSEYPFDYVLGAVHCLDHVAISARDESAHYFRDKTLDEVLTNYFRAMSQAVSSGLFDCMAHFDGYRKYGIRAFGKPILAPRRELVQPVLGLMADGEVGLEVNASAFRHGQDEPYPGKTILTWARETGVSVLTCGSDCHSVDQLGEGLDRARRILEELGLPATQSFRSRKLQSVR